MAACWQRHITSLHIRAHTRTQTRHSPRICGHPPLASDKCYLPHREHMKKWFSAEMTERREGRANATAVRELQGASWIKWVCWDRQTAVGGQKVSRRRSELLSWEVTNWTLIGSWKCRKGAKRRRGRGFCTRYRPFFPYDFIWLYALNMHWSKFYCVYPLLSIFVNFNSIQLYEVSVAIVIVSMSHGHGYSSQMHSWHWTGMVFFTLLYSLLSHLVPVVKLCYFDGWLFETCRTKT